MEKQKNGAFVLALLGNLVATLMLFSDNQADKILWAAYAFVLGLCMEWVVQHRRILAIATALVTLGIGIALLLRRPEVFGTPLVLMALAVLFIVWPLRFIALGEMTAALLFGFLYWNKTFQVYGLPEPRSIMTFSLLSSLFLLMVAFFENAARYSRQKSVQYYSLPVLLGNIFPALDRRWQKHAPSPWWSMAFALAYAVGCPAFVGFLHA